VGTLCPAASQWRLVPCSACFATKAADVHARSTADADARLQLGELPADDRLRHPKVRGCGREAGLNDTREHQHPVEVRAEYLFHIWNRYS
jgi:hypothetical protein